VGDGVTTWLCACLTASQITSILLITASCFSKDLKNFLVYTSKVFFEKLDASKDVFDEFLGPFPIGVGFCSFRTLSIGRMLIYLPFLPTFSSRGFPPRLELDEDVYVAFPASFTSGL